MSFVIDMSSLSIPTYFAYVFGISKSETTPPSPEPHRAMMPKVPSFYALGPPDSALLLLMHHKINFVNANQIALLARTTRDGKRTTSWHAA